jgi:hypothetical protein
VNARLREKIDRDRTSNGIRIRLAHDQAQLILAIEAVPPEA